MFLTHISLIVSFALIVLADYKILSKTDAPSLDIGYAGTTNVTELKTLCDKITYCAGFNTDGWLKYSVTPTSPSSSDLYVKYPPPPPLNLPPFNVWPQPASWVAGKNTLPVAYTSDFFLSIGYDSDILNDAIARYTGIIFEPIKDSETRFSMKALKGGQLSGITIRVLSSDDTLQYGTDESYNLDIPYQSSGSLRAKLYANTVYGALRGLETFTQLISYNWEGQMWIDNLPLNITDEPRYLHRSLLIDSSRHFLSVDTIFKVIDGMAATKLNVLHWHIVDSQSFPYVSVTYPLLSQKGSYDPKRTIYKPDDVQRVIQYAKYRGIRVMPEFDMPAHTDSWFEGYPQLKGSAACGFDPTLESTYEFVENFLKEIVKVFPEKYIHLGGDELDSSCWDTPQIQQWMTSHNISSFSELESYFEKRILAIAAKLGALVMIWQDPFNNGVRPQPETIIEVWRGADYKTLKEVVDSGYSAVMSGFWYLDSLGSTWADYYIDDPVLSSGLSPSESKLVVGGEACMWGEWVDYTNIESRIFPRASAVAEVLWSPESAPKLPQQSAERLHQWRCRMNRRGLNAEPVGVQFGVSFCDPL